MEKPKEKVCYKFRIDALTCVRFLKIFKYHYNYFSSILNFTFFTSKVYSSLHTVFL